MFLGSDMGSSLNPFTNTAVDQLFSFSLGERCLQGMTFIHRLFTKMAKFLSFPITEQIGFG
jgi:hypothetical protein